MSDSDKPRGMRTHVFISYAREDQEIAVEVARALQEAGIRPWIDLELKPGTPNWDRAIRGAIEASFAVVLIASGATAESDYVGTELMYGKGKGLEVIPLWVEGATWADCVPGLQWLQAQYIDARGADRESGVTHLVGRLAQLIRESTPGHFLVRDFRRRVKGEHGDVAWVQETRKPLPPGCCSIELDDPGRDGGATGDAIVVNCFAWRSMGQLSDELYSGYFAERFPPYTYGRDWVFSRVFKHGRRFALPWSWLLNQRSSAKDRSVWNEDSDCAPMGVGMVPGSRWVITAPTREKIFGLLTEDVRILDALLENPKVALYGFDVRKILKSFRASEVDPERFRVAAVVSNKWGLLGMIEAPLCGRDATDRDMPWVIAQTETLADSDVGRMFYRIFRRGADSGIGSLGRTDAMAAEDLI